MNGRLLAFHLSAVPRSHYIQYCMYSLQELSVTKEGAILNLRLNEATDPMPFVRLVSCGPQEQKWRFTRIV